MTDRETLKKDIERVVKIEGERKREKERDVDRQTKTMRNIKREG